MAKRTMIVERETWRGYVTRWVQIKRHHNAAGFRVCVRGFREIAGFTPRKGQTYNMDVEISGQREV